MRQPIHRFIRHYLEMVVGMVALGLPAGAALQALGSGISELRESAPAVLLLGMAVIMTVPMLAWMSHRGHGWRAGAEMAASMFLPTFCAVALLAAGAADFDTLMVAEHFVMLPSMLVAMLLRFGEYAHAHGDEDD
jgi:hypothetical protein